jgi:aspartate/methionine/tyrosine aminotransferase
LNTISNTDLAKRPMGSSYLEWAKLSSHAKYNLATSGIANVPLGELPVRIEELELTSAGSYGYGPLLERLAEHFGVSRDRVVSATGASMANHLAMAAVVEPGDEVLIEEPAYEPFLAVARYLHADVKRFPRRCENGFQIDPDDVKRAITPSTRLVVVSNLHNPTGARTSEEMLRRIGEIAAAAGAHVLVDEVFLQLPSETGTPSAAHLGANFMATGSLTKAYGLSGLRCGWVVASADLAKRMRRLDDLFGLTQAHIAERLSVIALDHFDAIAARARSILKRNRPLLDQFLDARADLDAVRPAGGTIVFPRLVRGSADGFSEFLRERFEASVVPGRFFDAPDHFRIGIGGATELVCEGLRRLAAALDEFKRIAT